MHKPLRIKNNNSNEKRDKSSHILEPENRWTLSNNLRPSGKVNCKLVVRKATKEPDLNPRTSGRCRNR